MKSDNIQCPKNVGMSAFFEKSYKNTRTKISATPYGVADIFMLKKAGTAVSGRHFLSSL